MAAISPSRRRVRSPNPRYVVWRCRTHIKQSEDAYFLAVEHPGVLTVAGVSHTIGVVCSSRGP